MTEPKRILILGNGPSTRALADWGLENLRSDVDTFGMGIAYRFFREANWWPTYYALGDSKVVFSHRAELAEVVEDPDVSTERFFFSWPVTEHPRLERIHHCSTGDFCLRKSLELRYQEIYLIGIEGHYVEELPESRPLSDDESYELGFDQLNLPKSLQETLRIISETPKDNPNYFFYGYQQAGDVYSLPQSNIHRNRWTDAAELAELADVRVTNLSAASRIGDFPRSTLSNIADRIFSDSAIIESKHAADLFTSGREGDKDVASTQHARKTHARPPFWYGPFARESAKRVEEARVILDLFRSAPPVNPQPIMVDVGACKGGAFRDFAKQGKWIVHAFEPNPPLFKDLIREFDLPNVTLNASAVSNVEGEGIPFYTSEESIGISSLKPFRPTHEVTAQVRTVTLDNYLREHDLPRIEFLKIDTEGFDLMVLKGLDLVRHPVDVILCEFEESKTKPLGYSSHDLAAYLKSFGYTIYVSEWHPVIRYGVPHQWRALKLYPCELEEPDAWGNFLAFKSDPGIWAVTKALNNQIRSVETKPRSTTSLRAMRRALERPLEWAAKTAIHKVFRKRQGGETSGRSRNAA